MNNVKKEADRLIITLNPLLYPIEKVKKAAIDFRGVGKISIKQDLGIKVIIIPKSTININEIGFQFCDYVLSLMQAKL